jgi:hypothetical protein
MRVNVPWPAAPALNETIVLFTTHPKAPTGGTNKVLPPPCIPPSRLSAVEIVWQRNNQASAANGIRVYTLDDTDTWRETDIKDNSNNATVGAGAPQAVPALVAPAEWRTLIDAARYRGIAVEYTAGAAPTQWNGTITLHLGAEAVIR